MDAVIGQWVTVVTPSEAGTGGLGLMIKDLDEYFYLDDGLVASTQLERLQRKFDVFTGLFNQFGIQTNMAKTVDMICQPCHAPGGM